MTASDNRPCHLVAGSDDKVTVCGIKRWSGDDLPYMLVNAAPSHRREFAKCEPCYLVACLGQLLIAHLTIPPEMQHPFQVPLDT